MYNSSTISTISSLGFYLWLFVIRCLVQNAIEAIRCLRMHDNNFRVLGIFILIWNDNVCMNFWGIRCLIVTDINQTAVLCIGVINVQNWVWNLFRKLAFSVYCGILKCICLIVEWRIQKCWRILQILNRVLKCFQHIC